MRKRPLGRWGKRVAADEAGMGTTTMANARSMMSRFALPALWMSAGVMLGLVLFRSEPLMGMQGALRGGEAWAGLVSHAGNMAILTSESHNEDIAIVLDGRTEQLLIYRTSVNDGVQLSQRLALPQMFVDARARAQGRE